MNSRLFWGFVLAVTMSFSCSGGPVGETGQWAPVGDRIMTEWASQVDPDNVLPEYPRPQLVRGEWQNLNGLWDYAITEKDAKPETYEGKILVPFAAESALSGVGRSVTEKASAGFSQQTIDKLKNSTANTQV